MAYVKRYAGGFVDKPTLTTPEDAQFLNAVETSLLRLDGTNAADKQTLVWDNVGGAYVPRLITNANIDPAAAIDKSKLGPLAIVDADVSGAASISRSKLNFGGGLVDSDIAAGAAIAASKIAGLGATYKALYRKTTAKTVNNSVVETDLLNGEITIAAGVLGTTGVARLSTAIDALNNSGGIVTYRVKLKLGATTVFDSGIYSVASSATRGPLLFEASIRNLGAANSQSINGWIGFVSANFTLTPATPFTTGEGAAFGFGSAPHMPGYFFNTSAVDTTAAQVLALTITMGTSNALAETKLYGALVEVI